MMARTPGLHGKRLHKIAPWALVRPGIVPARLFTKLPPDMTLDKIHAHLTTGTLCDLPGIGPQTALSVIWYFTRIHDDDMEYRARKSLCSYAAGIFDGFEAAGWANIPPLAFLEFATRRGVIIDDAPALPTPERPGGA